MTTVGTIVRAGLPALVVMTGIVRGNVVDLTTAMSSGTIGGVIFRTIDLAPTGTGVINSFVRIQHNGTEQGYNTSGRPVAFNELTDPNFTRNLTLGEVPVVAVGGTDYYSFNLDINEPNGGGQNLLSLDEVQIYTSSVGSQTTSNVSSLGTLRYDLDVSKDSWVKLDYDLGSGSGRGDMEMLVPVSFFGGSSPNTFVYLFSRFGDNFSSGDGFEEWSVVIPLPPALYGALGILGVVVTAQQRRRGR
jgi:hypothetical protein